MNLIQRIFGMKEVGEDDLNKERTLLLSKVPLERQNDAWRVWDGAYYSYRKKCMEQGIYYFEIEGILVANKKLRDYVRKLR